MKSGKRRPPRGNGKVTLPNGWRPRWYQGDLWQYLQDGGRRGLAVCHRRWGKDDIALHWTACAAHEKVATYWHMLPEYEQARKSVWNAINPHTGIRRIDEAFPDEIRKRTHDQGMFIEFKNGSTWQLVGSDNFNSIVGSPPYGIVMSEWALANPSAWAYMSPILEENGGWALFIYTSRGQNHGYDFYQAANTAMHAGKDWYAVKQTVEDTDVFEPDQLENIKAELVSLYGDDDGESLFAQEYYCDFNAAIVGSYYGKLLSRLEHQGRIRSVPWEQNLPVYTAWDLGLDDNIRVWFAQCAGREVRVIDHMTGRGKGLIEVAKEVIAMPYVYGEHYLPHDVETREHTTARTRKETLEDLGLRPIRAGVSYPGSVADGIQAVRAMLPRCVFDAASTKDGRKSLAHYHVEWDDKTKTSRKVPKHDWSSHDADAFRELAVNLTDMDELRSRTKQQTAVSEYDVYNLPGQSIERPSSVQVFGGYYRDDPTTWGERRQETAGVEDYDPWSVK